jgi:hypothetical protein
MSVLLGTYIGLPDNSGGVDPYVQSATYNEAATEGFAAFTKVMGQAPTLMNTYVDYTVPEERWPSNAQWAASSWAANPWCQSLIPDVGIPMAAKGESATTSFENIISGSRDSLFKGIFQAWAGHGYKNFFIRPGWEMNGDWYPWSVTGANSAKFVAAFRHIADLAHAFPGAKIQVVWSLNVGASPVPPVQVYPGNKYVDVVGLDTYGPPHDHGNPPGNLSKDPHTFTLIDALAISKRYERPFAVPETGGFSVAFAKALADTIVESRVSVAFIAIWDVNDSNGKMRWSHPSDNRASAAAGWKAAFNRIATASPMASSSNGVDPVAANSDQLSKERGHGSTPEPR